MVRSPDVGEGWGGIYTFPTAIIIPQLWINPTRSIPSMWKTHPYSAINTTHQIQPAPHNILNPEHPYHHLTPSTTWPITKLPAGFPSPHPHPSLKSTNNHHLPIFLPISLQPHAPNPNDQHPTMKMIPLPWRQQKTMTTLNSTRRIASRRPPPTSPGWRWPRWMC